MLPSYLNKMVEVFLDSGYYEGILISVSDSSIRIQMVPGYNGPTENLNVILAKVKYLRVLSP